MSQAVSDNKTLEYWCMLVGYAISTPSSDAKAKSCCWQCEAFNYRMLVGISTITVSPDAADDMPLPTAVEELPIAGETQKERPRSSKAMHLLCTDKTALARCMSSCCYVT